jgi:hypothetical protein
MNFLEALSVLFREREREREREIFFGANIERRDRIHDYGRWDGLSWASALSTVALAAHIFNIRCATLFIYLLFSLRSLIEYNHKSPSQ